MTIASTEEDEFVESVLECAVKVTIIVEKIKTLVKPLPNLKCSSQVQDEEHLQRVCGGGDSDHHQHGEDEFMLSVLE